MKRVRPGGFGVGMVAVSMLLAAAPALQAQRPPEARRGMQDRERLEQRIRAQMGRMMRERLNLTDEQAQRLEEVVSDFEGRRRALFREEQETRREVQELLQEPEPDPRAASLLLDRTADLRAREAALLGEEQGALREILTPVQILQLHELRADIGRRIRALRSRGGARREGGRRGPPPVG